MNLWPIRIMFGTAMLVAASAFFATGTVAITHLLRQHSLLQERPNAIDLRDVTGQPFARHAPVLLILHGEALVADHYELDAYRDTIMGEGECDWENEIACWSDIDDLADVPLSIEPVSKSRWEIHRTVEDREQRTKHFKPAGPRLADYELAIMVDTVDRLEEGDITAIRADAIIAAMRLMWTVLRSDETRADDLHPSRR